MSSPSEFDEYSDSIEHVCEDSSWDEASIALEVDENEETEILLSAVKLTRKVPLHRIRGRHRVQSRVRGGSTAFSFP